MRTPLVLVVLLAAGVAKADVSKLFHLSPAIGMGRAYAGAGLQAELGVGPLSVFGSAGKGLLNYPQNVSFAGGLKGYFPGRGWFVGAHFYWEARLPAGYEPYNLDRQYSISAGFGRKIALPNGFFLEAGFNFTPQLCERWSSIDGGEGIRTGWHCGWKPQLPQREEYVPDISAAIGYQVDASGRVTNEFASVYDAAASIGLVSEAVFLALAGGVLSSVRFDPVFGPLMPLGTFAAAFARPVFLAVAAAFMSSEGFNTVSMIRMAIAAVVDAVGLFVMFHGLYGPLPAMWAGIAIRAFATPAVAAYGLAMKPTAPVLSLRF